MENNNQISVGKRPLKAMIKDDEVQDRFKQMLGSGSPAFLMSVLNCVSNNDKLSQAEPQSILMAAAVAATLNLPIDPNLGLAYIIPYNEKIQGSNPVQWRNVAQFQIGYKGIIALCHRSGEYNRINAKDVRQGEINYIDGLTGDISYNWIQDIDEREKLPIIGYVAFFRLTNGFEKQLYMTVHKLEAHAKKYSKTYKNGGGKWNDDKDSMSLKTVLKLLLDKYGPKSVDLLRAIKTDQAVVEDYEGQKVRYIDNEHPSFIPLESPEQQQQNRISEFISNCNDINALEQFENIELSQENLELLKSTKLKLSQNGTSQV